MKFDDKMPLLRLYAAAKKKAINYMALLRLDSVFVVSVVCAPGPHPRKTPKQTDGIFIIWMRSMYSRTPLHTVRNRIEKAAHIALQSMTQRFIEDAG